MSARFDLWGALVVVWVVALVAESSGAAEISVPGDYPTIQEAVDAAAAGDTIRIDAIDYDEPVRIVGLQQLQLVVTTPPETTAYAALRSIHVEGSSDIAMRGFRFDYWYDDPTPAVAIQGSERVTLERSLVEEDYRIGVEVRDSRQVTLQDLEISSRDETEKGVLLSASDSTVRDVRVEFFIDEGIRVIGDDNTIANNLVENPGRWDDLSDEVIGILVEGKRNEIDGNLVRDIEVSGDEFPDPTNTGIEIRSGRENRVHQNQVEEVRGHGIVVHANRSDVTENTVSEARDCGYLDGGRRNEFSLNEGDTSCLPRDDADVIRVPKDYPTIQRAIWAAGFGTTIRISQGVASESLEIERRKKLRLIGAGKPPTISCIDINDSSKIEIRGLLVKPFSGESCRAWDDGPTRSVNIRRSDKIKIADTRVRAKYPHWGVRVVESRRIKLDALSVESFGRVGIDLDASDSIIKNSRVSSMDCCGWGSSAPTGIKVKGDGNRIDGNVVRRVDGFKDRYGLIGAGIWVAKGSGNEIVRNRIERIEGDGIRVKGARNEILDNRVEDALDCDYVDRGRENVFKRNDGDLSCL